jgi:hypothetical protein
MMGRTHAITRREYLMARISDMFRTRPNTLLPLDRTSTLIRTTTNDRLYL